MRSRERSFGRWLRIRACFADHATSRNCRRTNERLAADTVLQPLRMATEVLRGR
jgi:hypothetical protein